MALIDAPALYDKVIRTAGGDKLMCKLGKLSDDAGVAAVEAYLDACEYQYGKGAPKQLFKLLAARLKHDADAARRLNDDSDGDTDMKSAIGSVVSDFDGYAEADSQLIAKPTKAKPPAAKPPAAKPPAAKPPAAKPTKAKSPAASTLSRLADAADPVEAVKRLSLYNYTSYVRDSIGARKLNGMLSKFPVPEEIREMATALYDSRTWNCKPKSIGSSKTVDGKTTRADPSDSKCCPEVTDGGLLMLYLDDPTPGEGRLTFDERLEGIYADLTDHKDNALRKLKVERLQTAAGTTDPTEIKEEYLAPRIRLAEEAVSELLTNSEKAKKH